MGTITAEAANRLVADKEEFIEMLGGLQGENIYEAGFTIAVHAKVFDMFFNNTLECDYLSDLILCNENPIVNSLTADYILSGITDFSKLEEFVISKVNELYPR
jgi:hypothetical protein